MAGDERRDQRQQRVQVGGQIHIHVGDDLGVGVLPYRTQCAAATLGVEVDHPHVVDFAREQLRDLHGVIGARIVGDGDPGRERESVTQVGVQPPHADAQVGLFVVDGDHDVQHGRDHLFGHFRPVRGGRRFGHGDYPREPRWTLAGLYL